MEFEVVWERNLMVPLRDGVCCATDVYLPARGGQPLPGPFPVVLERTPYDKLGTELVKTAKYFARHGYAVVLQDVRGRHASAGDWYPFAHEAEDGVDCCRWIVAQPWCNGQIATIGLSYSAGTQTGLAALRAPGVAAQFIAQGYHNYHNGAMRQGGALELRFYIYALRMARTSREAMADPVVKQALEKAHRDVAKWLKHTPPKPGQTPLRFAPSYERWVLDILQHGEYSPYWSTPVGYSIVDRYDGYADVPVYLLGSWYDTYVRSTLTNYVELSRRKGRPVRLIMGPWIHGVGSLGLSYSGDVEFGPDAAIDYDDLRRRWFDATVRGVDNGILAEPPVRIFVMGGGSGRRNADGRMEHGGYWRAEAQWPIARTQQRNLYLQPGGGLDWAPPAAAAACSRFRYDPKDPVPTIGGNISAVPHVMPGGGFDQRGRPDVFGAKDDLPLGARGDVLVFSTPPLPEDLEVTGPVRVQFWAASTAVDTDFTAKLIDAYPPNPDYPDGYELNITDSIIRARYRNSWDQPELMEPGQVYPFTIEFYATSNRFCRGHRIVLHISSSNYPRFDINPNTGEPLGTSHVTQACVNTIYHDRERPSHLVLPIIPA